MRALRFDHFGDPHVLHVAEIADPSGNPDASRDPSGRRRVCLAAQFRLCVVTNFALTRVTVNADRVRRHGPLRIAARHIRVVPAGNYQCPPLAGIFVPPVGIRRHIHRRPGCVRGHARQRGG